MIVQMSNYADILRKDISFLKKNTEKTQEFKEEKRDKKSRKIWIYQEKVVPLRT